MNLSGLRRRRRRKSGRHRGQYRPTLPDDPASRNLPRRAVKTVVVLMAAGSLSILPTVPKNLRCLPLASEMADQYSGLIARTMAGIGPVWPGDKSRCRRRSGDEPSNHPWRHGSSESAWPLAGDIEFRVPCLTINSRRKTRRRTTRPGREVRRGVSRCGRTPWGVVPRRLFVFMDIRGNMTSQQIEVAISEEISRFEQDYMGRIPKDTHVCLSDDLLLIRLRGIL